jgi:SH3-like domain-containing protein
MSGNGRRQARALAGLAALLLGMWAAAPAAAPRTGPETGLPLPRYVSLKAAQANVRRGPGLTHRVDWVFVRRGMPLQVIGEYGHWRRVRDMDAATGWIHYSLLRGERTAVVVADTVELREDPGAEADVVARAERGVVLSLEACGPGWCEVSRGSVEGWAPKRALWGADAEETFD